MTSTTTQRATRRDATENREAILAAAVRMLQADPDARLDDIASEAGLSRRAFYGHFATRDELLEEVFTIGAVRVSAAILPVDEADPALAIALVGSRLWGEVAHIRANASLALRDPFRARTVAVLQPLRDRLVEIVRDGIASGRFRQDIEAAVLARLIEGAALAVLDEATRSGLSVDEGKRLVVLNTLSCAGVDWREARHVIESSAELSGKAAV